MRYYKHLYLTEGLEKKKEKIIRKLESGKLQLSVHVITLAISEKNQLEIYPTLQFKQPAFPDKSVSVLLVGKRILYVWEVDIRNCQSGLDRKSTRLNSSHITRSRMPSSA